MVTNTQLETFVYSIAHDLRAPLRAMSGFSAILLDEASAGLSAMGQMSARRISRAARFMDALLVDLVAFSQISRGRIEVGPINLEPVMRSAVERVDLAIQEKKLG